MWNTHTPARIPQGRYSPLRNIRVKPKAISRVTVAITRRLVRMVMARWVT